MPNKHLYLPKLRSGANGANIDEPVSGAVWEDKSKKIILSISDGIEIDESVHTRGVSSIPDIYARPLTFLSALRSEKHPLRNLILQEWKGLISLLALHRFNQDLNKLTIVPISLSTVSGQAESQDNNFVKALKNLAPRKIRLQKNGVEYDWTDVLLIKFEDISIGAFSPATLVYTSADYNEKLKTKSFPLKDENGYLKPPSVSDGLEFVGEWLAWFINQFDNYANGEDNKNDKQHEYAYYLKKILKDWKVEINQQFGLNGSENIDTSRVRISDEPIEILPSSFLPKYDIYKLLLTPLVKDESFVGSQHKSEYALKPSRNTSGYSEVVVISPALLAQDKVLWEVTKPSQLNKDTTTLINSFFKEASGTRINNVNLQNENAIWIRPELYFLTKTLLKAKHGEILPYGETYLNGNNNNYILPLKKEILQFFSPEDIRDVLKPRYDLRDDKIIFSFNLPLINNQSIEIKKVFKTRSAAEDEGQIVEIDVPVLEIFPDYLGDFWCQYFVLFGNNEKFKITPLNFEFKTHIYRKQQTKSYNNQTADKSEIIRITGYNCFPEAIGIDAVGNNTPMGVIFLKKDEAMKTKSFDQRCTIGIDFGTSNTNIYKKVEDNAERLKFHFADNLRRVLNSDNATRQKLTQLFFIPATYQDLPVPTALRIFHAGVTENLLLDYFIYFPDEYKYPDNVYTNLKWDDDNTKVNIFLNALIFLLLIDIIRERYFDISFRCTFPKSFSGDRKLAYERAWEKVLSSIFYQQKTATSEINDNQFIYVTNDNLDIRGDEYKLKTLSNNNLIINVRPLFKTEGIAAGEYFSSKIVSDAGKSKADRVRGAVCIDVGGGTTDYSIWFANEIKFDCSVLLAGKQLSKLIQDNSRVRDILFSEEAKEALNETKGNEEKFSSRLNFILKKEEADITNKLGKNANNKDIAWLRRALAIEFGALSFYAGHICLALNDHLNGEFSNKVGTSGIKLHWGGNAAKLINWIDFGKYINDGTASTFLNMMFYNAIVDEEIGKKSFADPYHLDQVQSPGHKDEASGGVIFIDNDLQSVTTAVSTAQKFKVGNVASKSLVPEGIVIGENVLLTAEELFHYDVVPENKLFQNGIAKIERSNLVQIKKFIFLINEIGKVTGLFPEGYQVNLTPAEYADIESEVINNLTKQAQRKPENRLFEPVFILEVRALLDKLSHKMK